MADYISGNAFMQGFMQGYSFLDGIASRKKAEERLERRLAQEQDHRMWMRARQNRADYEAGIDRQRRRSAEDDAIARQREADEVNQALSGVDPNDYNAVIEALTPYSRNPAAAAAIARARELQQKQADDMRLARGPVGLAAGAANVAGGVAPGATPGGENIQLPYDPSNPVTPQTLPGNVNQQATPTPLVEGANGLVPAAGTTAPNPVDVANQRYSKAELEALAVVDPEGAARVRDEQAALDQDYIQSAPLLSDPEVSASRSTPRKDRVRKAEGNVELTRNMWEASLDVNNPDGDSFRKLPSTTQVGQYYRDRSALTADQKARGDRLMAPHIEQTIQQSKEILANPDLDPNSLDAANARRKLKEAYAARNARADYKVLEANGINPNGLPVLRNEELSDRVIENAVQQPGPPGPATASQAKAEDRVLERGPKNGRISDAFASAAWRKYARGEIDYATFVSYVKTGKPPPNVESALQKIKEADGSEAVYSIMTDKNTGQVLGVQKVIQGGSKTGGRNVLDGEPWDMVQQRGKELAEEFGKPTMASDFAIEFANILGEHERMATLRGYDYSNIQDVAALWTRYKQLQTVSAAIEDEFRFRGKVTDVTFEGVYGMTVAEALFTEFDEGDLSELEVPGTTTFGFGGESPRVSDLRNIDPRFFDAVRAKWTDMKDMTNEQILMQLDGG